jgi:ArsR family transcriptional regulator
MAKSGAYCDCDVVHEEIVNKVRQKLPEDAAFSQAADLFKTFSDITRVKILWLLSCNELCVCDLAVLLDMSKSAVSHKLQYLRLQNLVDFRKEGRIAFYFLADTHVKTILKEGFGHFTS